MCTPCVQGALTAPAHNPVHTRHTPHHTSHHRVRLPPTHTCRHAHRRRHHSPRCNGRGSSTPPTRQLHPQAAPPHIPAPPPLRRAGAPHPPQKGRGTTSSGPAFCIRPAACAASNSFCRRLLVGGARASVHMCTPWGEEGGMSACLPWSTTWRTHSTSHHTAQHSTPQHTAAHAAKHDTQWAACDTLSGGVRGEPTHTPCRSRGCERAGNNAVRFYMRAHMECVAAPACARLPLPPPPSAHKPTISATCANRRSNRRRERTKEAVVLSATNPRRATRSWGVGWGLGFRGGGESELGERERASVSVRA